MAKKHVEPLSPDAEKEFGQALKDVFSSVLRRAEEERQQTDPWKDLFAASEQGLRGILSEAKTQMQSVVLNTVGVIETKFNIICSRKLYDLVKALPYVMSQLRDAIQDQQGNACCADKAREVYYREVLEEINRLKAAEQAAQEADASPAVQENKHE